MLRIIDTETCGLQGGIVEIASVDVIDGKIVNPMSHLVRQGGALQICPAPGAGLAARPAGGGGGFCGWNRCRAHRRRGGDPAHAASCRRVYHGIYGIVPAGLPHGKAPPEEGLSHMCHVRAAQALRRLRRP